MFEGAGTLERVCGIGTAFVEMPNVLDSDSISCLLLTVLQLSAAKSEHFDFYSKNYKFLICQRKFCLSTVTNLFYTQR